MTFGQTCINTLHGIFPIIGMLRYGIIGKRMTVIGITGTDGKSSSVILTAAMLRALGYTVAHYSSISFHDGKSEYPNDKKMTTPGHMQLHTFLRRAELNGCTHAVLEITSQGILQHRHRGIGFSLIGITNITPEHIEAHGGFENYEATKLSLVRSLRKSPHNHGLVIDESTYARVYTRIPQNISVHTVSLTNKRDSRVQTRILQDAVFGSTLELAQNDEKVTLSTGLGGPFAPQNIAFSIQIASVLGVPLNTMKSTLESIQTIPGRFEIISTAPLIIVDYAHTLHALEVLLPYVRKRVSGKLVHVFGAAGGGRDRYKRPLLARISEQSADVSILTEENSFDEPVDTILADIKGGFTAGHPFSVEPKREDAVRLGLNLLTSKDDALLLTAKGSETVIAGPRRSKRPYHERAYVQCLYETSSFAS